MQVPNAICRFALPWAALLLSASCASSPALRASDGLKLIVEEQGPSETAAAGTRSKPTLVLLHGWACDRSFWGQLPERLGRDHRVVTMDLAGHGKSGTGRLRWSLLGLGDDVQGVCDELGLDDVVLIGHSMGATVALEAAARMHDRVRGVIAIDSFHDLTGSIPKEMIDEIVRLFETNWSAAMDGAVSAMVPAGGDSDLARWIVARAVRTNKRAALAIMRSSAGLDLSALARAAAVPLRAVNAAPAPKGSKRPGGGETMVDANKKLFDFDVLLVEGVGHYLQLERPGLVEADIRVFLREFEAG